MSRSERGAENAFFQDSSIVESSSKEIVNTSTLLSGERAPARETHLGSFDS